MKREWEFTKRRGKRKQICCCPPVRRQRNKCNQCYGNAIVCVYNILRITSVLYGCYVMMFSDALLMVSADGCFVEVCFVACKNKVSLLLVLPVMLSLHCNWWIFNFLSHFAYDNNQSVIYSIKIDKRFYPNAT